MKNVSSKKGKCFSKYLPEYHIITLNSGFKMVIGKLIIEQMFDLSQGQFLWIFVSFTKQ